VPDLPAPGSVILFADGGQLASKPYAASGAYINKMSNYCGSCRYKHTVKNGPTACPFNYLYWDFIARNEVKLRGNPRMGFMYKSLDRMSDEKRQAIQDDTRRFFKAIDDREQV
jgi:deoxyribodipyrimidine photolyase-related protein